MLENVLTAGALTILLLEGIKFLIRAIKKNPTYDFPALFYAIIIPVLNAVMPFPLFYLGVISTDPILTMTFAEIVKYLLVIFLSSIISVMGYNGAIKKLKNYEYLRKNPPTLIEGYSGMLNTVKEPESKDEMPVV